MKIEKKQHFEHMASLYFNHKIIEFKINLKRLSKADLLRFILHCELYCKDFLSIYEIEKEFNN